MGMSMDTGALTAKLKGFIFDQGADLVGIAPVDRFAQAPEGHRPEDYLPGARSVVVIAIRLLDSIIDALPESRPRYTEHFFATNTELNISANRTARFLVKQGFSSAPIYYSGGEVRIPYPAPFFDEMSFRHAAVEAGLGRIGQNQLFITPQFGPRVRLIIVLTQAELCPDEKIKEELCQLEKCGYRCLINCFPGALKRDGTIDKPACAKYMFETLNYLRCGMCVASCPIPLDSS